MTKVVKPKTNRPKTVLSYETGINSVKLTVSGPLSSDVLYRFRDHLDIVASEMYKEEKS